MNNHMDAFYIHSANIILSLKKATNWRKHNE